MRKQGLALALVLALALETAGEWHFSGGGGFWALGPFRSLLEREAARLVERQVQEEVGPLLPPVLFLRQESDIRFSSSSGSFFALGCRYRFPSSRWSLGVEAVAMRLFMPLDLELRQSLTLVGFELASASSSGSGRLEIRTVAPLLLAEWRAWPGRRLALDLGGGLMLLPFSGRLRLSVATAYHSLTRDGKFASEVDGSLSRLRHELTGVPAVILSPVLRASLKYACWRRIESSIALTLAHGWALSASLSCAI